MTTDHATATFDADVAVQGLVFGWRVFDYPVADDALLLIPVHGYCHEDHFDDAKGAMMATKSDSGADYRITSAYLGDRTGIDLSTGPAWQEGRLYIDDDGTITAWHQDPSGDWTIAGREDVGRESSFVEVDTMTEIQFDDQMDLPATHKGQILTQWRWVQDASGDWHRPDDVLSLQDGSNNDGDHAQIDFAVDQDDGRFYFYHYVE